jgi:TRAP-type mannitol/chloroaromatic compound transport system permease small subunit
MNAIVSFIDRLVERAAVSVRYFVVGIIGLVVLEVVCRAVFNVSFTWTREIAQWLGAAIILIGGAYAFTVGKFVRVDIFYLRLSERARAIIDLVLGSACFWLVAYVLVKHGGKFAMDSIGRLEVSTAAWHGPVWIAKLLIPVGGFLMSLAWISFTLKNIKVLIGGMESKNLKDATDL